MINFINFYNKVQIFLFPKKEVYVTFDTLEYSNIIQNLKKAKINYSVKSTYMGFGNQPGGRISSFGQNAEKQTEYQVYVQRKDYERAAYVINCVKQGL